MIDIKWATGIDYLSDEWNIREPNDAQLQGTILL